MIRVGLVTTWGDEKCGHRTYAEELVEHVTDPDIVFKPIGRPFDAQSIISRTDDCDIVHFNHAWQLFGSISASHIQKLKSQGKKTICTFHESTTENRSDFTVAFDRVIVHQKTSDGFTRIKDGILHPTLPPYEGKYSQYVGVVGFPFAYKNYVLAAQVAQQFGLKLYAFTPQSHHVDAEPYAQQIKHYNPESIIRQDFAPSKEIIEVFSQCLFTMFPYAHTGTGIGGSVRLGIAARRPVVISNVVRFMDLLDEFPEEFYVIPSPYPAIEDTTGIVQSLLTDIDNGTTRFPDRVIEAMNWTKSAAAYVRVYKELMGMVPIKFEDLCDQWTPKSLESEDEVWKSSQFYFRYADIVRSVARNYNLESVVELGCGAGYVGNELAEEFKYLGCDGSAMVVKLAKEKFPNLKFVEVNIRSLPNKKVKADLVCSFAVLKHFGLEDWKTILHKVLTTGKYTVLQVQVIEGGDPSVEDGNGVHHTWINADEMRKAYEEAGHEILEVQRTDVQAWMKNGFEWIVISRVKG